MDPHDISVHLRALDGQWEVVGAEAVRYRGVWPEHFKAQAGEVQGIIGSDTCSFELRRDPGAIHPDLAAFTDCEVWIAGAPVWWGRVKETPTREGEDSVISVQGEGWLYHCDDDQYERAYLHTRLNEWVDGRTLLTTTIGTVTNGQIAAGQVNTGSVLVLSFPKDLAIGNSYCIAAILDLGEDSASWARKVSFDYETFNNTNLTAYLMAADTANVVAGTHDTVATVTMNGTNGTATTGAFVNARRYLAFVLQANLTHTLGADSWLKVTAARVFTDAAYESAGQSNLKADAIVKDALDKATMLLDPDRSGIEPGTTNLPEFVLDGPRSAREALQAANALENYELKLDGKRMLFRPRVAAPIFEIGAWWGSEFYDASANSGAEILNAVRVTGQDHASSPLTVLRNAGEQAGAPFEGIESPTPTNPSADVNTTGWTPISTGTVTRDTTTYDTAPASFSISPGGTPSGIQGTFTGTFRRGVTYRLQFAVQSSLSQSSGVLFKWGVIGVDEATILDPIPPNITTSFTVKTLTWTPTADRTGVVLQVHSTPGQVLRVDSLLLSAAKPTLVDRRGFRKSRTLPIRNRLNPAMAQRIGDLYLQQHRSTPFAGGFKAVGVGGVRRVLGGASAHPAWLLREAGQLVRASHVIDPDTGGIGRDERIKSVVYDHDTLTADVNMAEDRAGFETLLERLAVVVR